MTSVPRSQALLRYHGAAAGNSPQFTAPAGHVTLVKSAAFQNLSSSTQLAQIIFQVAGVAITVALVRSDLAAATSQLVEFWLVMNPGDGMYVNHTGDSFSCWISGAILEGEPRFPASDASFD